MDTTTKTIAKRPHDNLPARPRRRLRTIAEKRRIVEETFEPGASVSVVARRHDVNANLLFGWRKLYQAGMLIATESQAVPLIPVRMKRPRAEPTSPMSLEIVLPKGTIHLQGGIDLRMLQHVIEALA